MTLNHATTNHATANRGQPARALSTMPRRPADSSLITTAVMPYPGSRAARRTRRLRAWMLTLPVDACALLAPLVFTLDHWRGTVFASLLTLAIFAAGGLYQGRRHMAILDELPSLLGRMLVASAVVAVIYSQRHDTQAYVNDFLHMVVLSTALVLLGRAFTRWVVVATRRRRWVEHGALIVGGGQVAAELARLLRRHPEYGLRFAGFIDDDDWQHRSDELRSWVGRTDQLESMILNTESEVVILADASAEAEAQVRALVRRPAVMGCDLLVVPRLPEFATQVGLPDHIGAIPVVRVVRPQLSGPKWWLKRLADIVFSLLALVLFSPVLLVCAIGVRIEGGPGVFFRQERVGLNGRRFQLIKFRSMRPVDESVTGPAWSTDGSRVGPFGRFLRRTSLDELPQLWNVIRGEMTMVGPRPERPLFAEQFAAQHPLYGNRSRMPAGMTGLAQVSGLRGDTPIADRARFDNYYVENWSLWLDTKVLLRTVREVLRGGGR